MTNVKLIPATVVAMTLIGFASNVQAEAPDLKTPAPVIYLADNLDEKDKLGWCVDTVGRGFSERLHTHSCKPRGGDVQFSLDTETAQIKSATFDNKCAHVSDDIAAGAELALLDCKADEPKQQFVYDEDSQQFHPKSDDKLCLVVGESSKSAGPFMSRGLSLETCENTDAEFKQWVVLAAAAE